MLGRGGDFADISETSGTAGSTTPVSGHSGEMGTCGSCNNNAFVSIIQCIDISLLLKQYREMLDCYPFKHLTEELEAHKPLMIEFTNYSLQIKNRPYSVSFPVVRQDLCYLHVTVI